MKNWSKWVIYGVIPAVLSLVLQLMYFSGNLILQRLVCPKLPPLGLGAYREFGILENLQNLLLIGIAGVFAAGLIRARQGRLRLAYGVLVLFSVFVLLEEIDYGTHFYEYATTEEVAGWFLPVGSPEFQRLLALSDFSGEPFNIHNQGDLTDIIKAGVTLLMLGLFVVAPLIRDRVRNPWLRFVIPDRFILLTVAVMVLMRLVTRYLSHIDEAALASGVPGREIGSMNNNLSEFRELLTYYAFLLYAATLVFFRRAPGTAVPSNAEVD